MDYKLSDYEKTIYAIKKWIKNQRMNYPIKKWIYPITRESKMIKKWINRWQNELSD